LLRLQFQCPKRALIYLLSAELLADGLTIPDFPRIGAIKGIGLSDDASYAVPLAGKFDYTNTFYDREPYLDITQPDPKLYGTYDFILSSDVFEHVPAPLRTMPQITQAGRGFVHHRAFIAR
jgi:hypothetical protein